MQGKVINKIGWIGTGVMGNSMVQHLLKNNKQVLVYNRSKQKTDNLVQMGAKYSEINEMVKEVDCVILMVGYPTDLEKIIFQDKLVEKMKKNSILIDHTTSEPSLAIKIHEYCSLYGIDCLDCPVTGGDIGAKNGTLSILSGGNAEIFQLAKNEIFQHYGKNINLMGKQGMGQHAKMANQIAIAGQMIGLVESLLYSQQVGLDQAQLIEAIKNGAAASFSLNVYGPRILNGDFNPGFYVHHFVKDMAIVVQECQKMGIRLKGLELVHQLYQGLVENGQGNLGTQALFLQLKRINNLQ